MDEPRKIIEHIDGQAVVLLSDTELNYLGARLGDDVIVSVDSTVNDKDDSSKAKITISSVPIA